MLLQMHGSLPSWRVSCAFSSSVSPQFPGSRHKVSGVIDFLQHPGGQNRALGDRTQTRPKQPFPALFYNSPPTRTKQGLRRKLGTKSLARYVQAMRPEELLVDNLNDPDCLRIVCGGSLENLAKSFAENWQAGHRIRLERRAKTSNHAIPTRKKCLRKDGFLSSLQGAVTFLIQQATKRAAA
jgi:hypothetical protein